jgi:ATP-dependent RNA helicase DeaD
MTQPSSDEAAQEPLTFDALNLSSKMRAALAHAGYVEPTPVQSGFIPEALAGKDVMAQARTGTGKTAAYAIPLLETIRPRRQDRSPRALILVPTRELAVQVKDEVDKLAYGRKIATVALYGGKPIRSQIAKLQRGAEIIVGTPGRVLDHLSRKTLDLRGLAWVVLDEADRMLDIGFRPDIEKILGRCPRERQTVLLSATVPPPVERLATRYMHDPLVLNFSPQQPAADTIDQYYFTVDQEKKFPLLLKLLERERPEQAIVFCRTKRETDRVYNRLRRKLEGVDCIHGDMQQQARDRVMRQFRDGVVRVLVATDVVGRGIDVSGISHIINFDIPQSSDDYVHRVGRTGRMGREGVAYTFVTTEQGPELTRIEMLINRLLKREEMPDFESFARPTAEPAEDGELEPKAPQATPPGQRPRRRHRRAL